MAEYDTEDEVIAAIQTGDYEARKRKPSTDTKATLFAMFFSCIFWDVFCLAIASSFPKSDYSPFWYNVIGYGCFVVPVLIPWFILVPPITDGNQKVIAFFPWFLMIELLVMGSLWLLLFVPGTVQPPYGTAYGLYVFVPGGFLLAATICYFFSDTLRMRPPRPLPLSAPPDMSQIWDQEGGPPMG
jgi:hypothetical protein